MNFKEWYITEIVDVLKPKNIKKRNIIKNKHTNTAREVIEYKFITKMNNVVKVHFEPKGDDEYGIIFYVNDTLHDDKTERDYEILPGILHIIQNVSDKLDIKKITFEAFRGKEKKLYNINIEPRQYESLIELNKFENIIKNYNVKMIPPSQEKINLFKKFNKGIPSPLPDLDVSTILEELNKLKKYIEIKSISGIDDVIEKILIIDWKKFNISIDSLIKSLRDLEEAIYSNFESGVISRKNTREEIYKKLIKRNLSKNWNVENKNNFFTLTKIF